MSESFLAFVLFASLIFAAYFDYRTLAVVIFIAGIVAAYISNYRQKKREERQFEEMRENALSDEGILKSQLEFEKRIEQQIGLPDAFSGQEIYIYRNLIKVWFNELSARLRYREKTLKKVKMDFLHYMENLENEASYRYLALEGSEEKKDQYEADLFKSRGMVRAIEEGFAAAIGLKAVAELEVTRELPHDVFDDYGEKAPDGYYYEIDFAKRKKFLRQR
jgi:uncharacterized protein YjiS (DUF1127 family)